MATPVVAAAPAVTKTVLAPEPEPVVVAAAPVVKPAPVIKAADAAIGVVAVANGGAAGAALKARAMAALAARGVALVCLAEVCDAMQLPAAAKRMAASGKVGAVLALAALTEEVGLGCGFAEGVWGRFDGSMQMFTESHPTLHTHQGCLGKEMAAAVAGGLVAAAVAAPNCTIVPALLVAPTEQAAVAKAADAPLAAWVAAAMDGEQEAAFTVVPTGAMM